MPKWDVSLSRSETRSFKLHLVVCDLEGLLMDDVSNREKYTIKVQIEWAVPRNKYLARRKVERNQTSNQHVNSNGCVQWNEGFDHECKLKIKKSESFCSHMINLVVHGVGAESDSRATELAKFRMDIAKFAAQTETSENIIKLPARCCNIGSSNVVARLKVKLNSFQLQPLHKNGTVHPLCPTHLLPSLSICAGYQNHTNNDINNSTSESSSESDEEAEPSYRNLAATNHQLGNLITHKFVYAKDENRGKRQQYQLAKKSPLIRYFSSKNMRISYRDIDHLGDTPLLNKACREDGGDDIDNDRRYLFSLSQASQSKAQLNTQLFRILGSDRFEIGNWLRRKFASRDKNLELETEVFLASIDQRSEKASGAGACTALAAVIAYWLHQNPEVLPLRCELDKLIREGSSEWRRLCKEEVNREKFSDQHFDLDTVLQAQVRPLKVVQEKSYIGFFELENMPNQSEFLQGVMSFDSIWEELENIESRSAEAIYIVSWNDHFFILKVEIDAIYIIDTLGERLCEGCNKAFILKFSKDSKLYRVQPKLGSEKDAENQPRKTGQGMNLRSHQRIKIYEGKSACKEFIKGFLAALPLRELKTNIERGITAEAPLHRLLQIEFQYTAPCNNTANHDDHALINQRPAKQEEA